jgi:hypothetical protein
MLIIPPDMPRRLKPASKLPAMKVITDLRLASLMLFLLAGGQAQAAQTARPATDIVAEAVRAELAADQNDHSHWRYRDEQKQLDDSISIVVQTELGSVKRLIADSSQLAKQRKDGAQDGRSARELLNMLPTAFLWRIEGEDTETLKLHFEPNPAFQPPSLQARVLGAMNGELVVDKQQHRIETISGRLTRDVTFGFGFLGRLHAGGTFRVERRQVAPTLWQITMSTSRARRCFSKISARIRMKFKATSLRSPRTLRSRRPHR